MPGPADVEAAVDQDLEVEAGPGADPQQPHAALGAVCGLGQLNARDLLKPADPRQQVGPGPLPSPQVSHRLAPASAAPERLAVHLFRSHLLTEYGYVRSP